MKKKLRLFLGPDYLPVSVSVSLFLALLSAFSVCVFYHMRNYSDAANYYTNAQLSLAHDIFSTPSYLLFLLLVPVFGGLFFYCFREETEFGLSAYIASAFFAINIIFSLSNFHRRYINKFTNLLQL